jgi:hypothetical protein
MAEDEDMHLTREKKEDALPLGDRALEQPALFPKPVERFFKPVGVDCSAEQARFKKLDVV